MTEVLLQFQIRCTYLSIPSLLFFSMPHTHYNGLQWFCMHKCMCTIYSNIYLSFWKVNSPPVLQIMTLCYTFIKILMKRINYRGWNYQLLIHSPIPGTLKFFSVCQNYFQWLQHRWEKWKKKKYMNGKTNLFAFVHIITWLCSQLSEWGKLLGCYETQGYRLLWCYPE